MPHPSLPDDAARVLAQEFKVTGESQLFVDVPGAHLSLQPGASDRIVVDVAVSGAASDKDAEKYLDRIRLTTRQIKDTVRVGTDEDAQHNDPRWWAWLRQQTAVVHLNIRIPKSCATDVHVPGGTIRATDLRGTLDLALTGGHIEAIRHSGPLTLRVYSSTVEIEDFSGDSLSLTASSGSIQVSSVEARTVEVDASGCPVTLSNIHAPLDLRANGGPVRLSNIDGPLSARVYGGSVTLSGPTPSDADINTVGGPVRIALSDNLSADLMLEGDRVDLDERLPFRGDRLHRRVEGTLNGGGAALKARAIRGSVECQRV